MDTDLLREKLLNFAKENIVVVSLGVVGLIFLGYGLILLFSSHNPSDEITFTQALADSPEASASGKIMVDVEGGVVKPGVYSLGSNSRIQDALIASGGLSQNANREWVAQHINLAAKVIDGAKVYIPLQAENIMGVTSTTDSISIAGISINTATEKELDSLPGIGLVTAQKIISARPYSSLEDLISKKVISNSVFGKIKDKISL